MIVAIPTEVTPGERRVAFVPESVKRLVAKKIEVLVQAGAGNGACIADAEYEAVGAKIAPDARALYGGGDVIVKVQPPTDAEVALLKEGSTLVTLAYPLSHPALAKAIAARKVTLCSLDMIPRTTLAQMMDVLSSQATLAGYRAVILAAEALPKFFPMLMTAAGTIAPAKVLVLGAGVAGLQAIATARRLGAVVEAYDVRKVVKEQVESLGARFVNIDVEDAAGTGGYAKEQSDEAKAKVREVLATHVAKSDAVITTALIPGKKAPLLLPGDMVRKMRAGSVVVDIAAEQGGNCELTKPGERIIVDGVTIIGERNLPAQMAVHASTMFSRNMEKLLAHVTNAEAALVLDPKDEIVAGMVITRNGEIVHPQVAELVNKGAS
jgi:NAD(P) transhydrogenase subunit alpha